jgi:eukaryotic-like serine/threonine-protein kinase
VCSQLLAEAEELPWGLRRGFGAPNNPAERSKLQIPGYSIEAEIGRGGFGAVYRARRGGDGQIVAVKVMLAGVDVDDVAIQKFKREVTVNANLDHPNIVKFCS